MKVTNINGTKQNNCRCGSWLQHWKNFSGQIANECRAAGCSKKAHAGAHVQKDVNYDAHWYIVPFCREHNYATGKVEIVSGTKLVSANVSETCG